jgi:hypothetical protein
MTKTRIRATLKEVTCWKATSDLRTCDVLCYLTLFDEHSKVISESKLVKHDNKQEHLDWPCRSGQRASTDPQLYSLGDLFNDDLDKSCTVWLSFIYTNKRIVNLAEAAISSLNLLGTPGAKLAQGILGLIKPRLGELETAYVGSLGFYFDAKAGYLMPSLIQDQSIKYYQFSQGGELSAKLIGSLDRAFDFDLQITANFYGS